MKLYFVRHGVTTENESKKLQMHQSPLSNEGKQQARLLAEKLKKQGLRFDAVYTSSFERARETAEIISKELNIGYEKLEGIHEKLNPDHLYGVGLDDQAFVDFVDEMRRFWTDIDWKFRGEGESLREVITRAQAFEKHLLTHHQAQNILVVSHGVFGRCFITSCVLGDRWEPVVFMRIFHAVSIDNTGLTLLEYDEEQKQWKICFLNDYGHLK